MKLWGGRFTKETNQLVNNFNASLPFDRRFYKQDIEGSIAHVTMLAKQGILSNEDKEAIIAGLTSIRNDIDSGALQFDDEAEASTASLKLSLYPVSVTPENACIQEEAATTRSHLI